MAGISITGLISGSFDWKSVVDQLIQIDSTPISNLQTEQAANTDKLTSINALKADLTDLQAAADALKADGLFTGRTASSSTGDSTWALKADAGATAGTYRISVSQLATQAQRVGASHIGARLSDSPTVGLTVGTLRTATAITGGTFTVNDARIDIDPTDTLDGVFQKIYDATGHDVTAAYDPDTDTISLTSASGNVLLGSATDTSNFLSAMQLSNNGQASVTSAHPLGTVTTTATLATAGLAAPASGSGTFQINGVPIDYDASVDTLSSLITRINASTAGVTAAYDATNDRLTLTNNATGDTGMSAVDSPGGLLASLGLTTASGASYARGLDAQFSVNGGPVRTSKTNALDAAALGVAGLSVTADTKETQTITVKPNTDAMKTAVKNFISAFNTVQTDIESATKITTLADKSVKAAVLAGDREVEDWSTKLRSLAFSSVSGLSGTVSRLENLGIDFSSTDTTLSIKDDAKLTSALANHPEDVAKFFTQSSTGFVDRMDTYLDKLLDSRDGEITTQVDTINKQNTSITDQITTLQRRLNDERERLTNAFLAMQNAQSTAATQLTTITNMFSSSSSSSN